jgi:hypothetical protein
MKKSILALTVIMFASLCASAQMNVGVGLAYGTEVEKPAIVVNGQYFVNDKVAIAPGLIFYFPEKVKTTSGGSTYTSKSSFWEFNADVNYYFVESTVRVYAIGGLNVSSAKGSYKGPGIDVSSSNSEFGVNLGIGLDFKTAGKLTPFIQTKYTISDYDQLVLMGGVRFAIGK